MVVRRGYSASLREKAGGKTAKNRNVAGPIAVAAGFEAEKA